MHSHSALRTFSSALSRSLSRSLSSSLSSSAALTGTLAATFVAGGAWAHPGHGTTSADSPSHYLLEPLHLALVVAAVVAGGAFVALLRRQRGAHRR